MATILTMLSFGYDQHPSKYGGDYGLDGVFESFSREFLWMSQTKQEKKQRTAPTIMKNFLNERKIWESIQAMERIGFPDVQETARVIKRYFQEKPQNVYKLAYRMMDKGVAQCQVKCLDIQEFPREGPKLFKAPLNEKIKSIQSIVEAFEETPENQMTLAFTAVSRRISRDEAFKRLEQVYDSLNQEKCDFGSVSKYRIKFICRSSSSSSSSSVVNPGEIGIFSEGEKLYCQISDQDKIEIQIDESTHDAATSRGLRKDIFNTIMRTVNDDDFFTSMGYLEEEALLQLISLCGYAAKNTLLEGHAHQDILPQINRTQNLQRTILKAETHFSIPPPLIQAPLPEAEIVVTGNVSVQPHDTTNSKQIYNRDNLFNFLVYLKSKKHNKRNIAKKLKGTEGSSASTIDRLTENRQYAPTKNYEPLWYDLTGKYHEEFEKWVKDGE